MKDKFKIAFFDVDGTLFNHRTKEISKVTIDALKQLKANGIKICVATGRPGEMLDQLQDYIDDIDFHYVIASNGQAIFQKNQLVYKNFLHPEDVKTIIKIVLERDFALSLVGDGFNIINKRNDLIDESFEDVGYPKPIIEEVSTSFNKPVDHLVCYEKIDKMKYFKAHLKHSVMTFWSDDVFDFVPDNGVKVNGIKKVLKHLKIKPEEAIAFGDGQNDITMLEYVGFGVAMGNAGQYVKEASDYVCESIDDDGVYLTLKSMELI
ncbi:MAG: HAD family hydrolase [Erysipelotrichales bacterium]